MLVDELLEVQSGKEEGNRPLLQEALARCRKEGTTLVVAKLCRLSRDAAFVLTLMKDSKVRFRVASMPQADNFQLGPAHWRGSPGSLTMPRVSEVRQVP